MLSHGCVIVDIDGSQGGALQQSPTTEEEALLDGGEEARGAAGERGTQGGNRKSRAGRENEGRMEVHAMEDTGMENTDELDIRNMRPASLTASMTRTTVEGKMAYSKRSMLQFSHGSKGRGAGCRTN